MRVNSAKLNIIPSVIPSGFLCPPVALADKTMGKSGQIHGAKIVTSPERKAKNKRAVIVLF